MPSQDIRLTNTGSDLGIDGFHGDHDFPGIDYTEIEHPDSTRYAELGDTLELTVTNVTDAHHPFHLHGFSIQPIELTHASLSPYLFPYHEFKDNIDVPARYTLRFRVRLDDRFLMDGTTLGGGLGRWVFHCHIFFHASFGMISEFDVVAANGNEAPHVNSDFTSVEVVAGETATMTGTYFDVDGDAVTLESSIGTVTDTGGGTWSWSYPTTGAPNESQLVYVTATDSAGLKGQVAFSLTVGEIKSLKEDVLAQATALLPGPTAFDTKKLGELIVKLQQSLDPALWIDDNHIVDKDGNKVFDRERDAVKKLNELIKDGSIPDPTLQDMIDALVRADRAIASVALSDAIAASGDPKKIAESQNELLKAADEIAKLHFDHAIDHYKAAWKKAREAV